MEKVNFLKIAKTCELVSELKLREGVKTIVVDPYEKEKMLVEGPAIVFIVVD